MSAGVCVGSASTPEPNPPEPQRHRSSGDAELCAHGPKLLMLPPVDASSAVGEAKPPVRRERWWGVERVQAVVRRGHSAERVVKVVLARRGDGKELCDGGAADRPTSRRDLSRSPEAVVALGLALVINSDIGCRF